MEHEVIMARNMMSNHTDMQEKYYGYSTLIKDNTKATKKEENRRRFEHAVSFVSDSVEHLPDTPVLKKLRQFSRLLNSWMKRVSRERTHRFKQTPTKSEFSEQK